MICLRPTVGGVTLPEVRWLVPMVGAEARARVRKAQALNADIDVTLDEDDEARALRLWRPLAKAYPDDRAVMHGYVLALSRVYGEGDDLEILDELLPAALRLYSLDDETWEAASYAGRALEARGRVFGAEADRLDALHAYQEAERRAAGDPTAQAMCLHHQAKVLAFSDRREAQRLTKRAIRLAPETEVWRFDRDPWS